MKATAWCVLLLATAASSTACGSSAGSSGAAGSAGVAEEGGSNGVVAGASGATSEGHAGAGTPDGISQAGPATTSIVDRSCSAGSKLSAVSEGDISRPNRTTGTNGVFVDECDASGVLTEYVCDAPYTCSGQCAYVESGEVAPLKAQCGVGCRNGACLKD